MLGSLAAGALSGQQAAQQENEEEQQRQQQQAIQLYGLQSQRTSQERQDLTSAYQPIFSNISQLNPQGRADVLGEYGKRMGAIQPPDMSPVGKLFDKDSPLQSFFQGQGHQPAGTPAAPTGPPVYAGAPPPTSMPPAGGAPGAPPAVPGAVSGAPGAAPAPFSFTSPGGAQLQLQGVSDRDRMAQSTRLDRSTVQFKGRDLSPEFRQQVETGISQARAALAAAQTPEEFKAAQAQVDAVENYVAQIPRDEKTVGRTSYIGLTRRHDTAMTTLQKQVLTPEGAYKSLIDIRDAEKRAGEIAVKDPDVGVGMKDLDLYAPDLDRMEAARARELALNAKKDRTPAEDAQLAQVRKTWRGVAADIADKLHFGENAGNVANAAMNSIRGFIGMLAPSQRNAETVAGMLEARGLKPEADYVRAHNLNFGGEQAEQNTLKLMSGLTRVLQPGTPPQVQRAFADEIATQSQLTGHPISLDPKSLTRINPKFVPGTPEYKAAQPAMEHMLLENARLRAQNAVEIKGTKWQGMELDLATKQARLNQITGKGVDPALVRSTLIHKMSGYQNKANAAHQDYNRFMSQHSIDESTYDPEAWIKSGQPDSKIQDENTRIAVGYYRRWKSAVDDAAGFTNNVLAHQEKLRNKPEAGAGTTTPIAKARATQTQAGAGLKTVTVNGQKIPLDPAKTIALMKSKGWSDQQIQARRAQDGW